MTRIESIANLYVATFGKDATKAQLKVYTDFKETVTLESISATMAGAEGAIVSPSTAEAQVKAAYANVFGYTDAELTSLVSTDGFAYWVKEVKENPFITTETLNIALLKGADASDEAKALTHSAITLANYNANSDDTSVNTSDYILLTEGQDILTGTDADDTFIARGNNSFNNSDIIDGGAGRDTVEVMLDNGESAESPLLTNIEVLKVQGQNTSGISGDNNTVRSSIDAGDMKSVEEYWSEDSRSNVLIEDISRDSNITTIGMRETDANVDYTAYYDLENINKDDAGSSASTLIIKLANVLNIAKDTNPIEGFASLDFKVGDTTVTVSLDGVDSYVKLDSAIEAALSAAGITDVTVVTSPEKDAYFSIDVETFLAGSLAGQYSPILVTSTSGAVLTEGNISLSESSTSGNMTNTMTKTESSPIPSLTQTNVILDRVGRDSDGGSLIIGADSNNTNGGNSSSQGIQQFNVVVDRNSSLSELASTRNTLEVINVSNISDNNKDGNGSLKIQKLENVRVFDASSMKGSADITATLDDSIVSKYLDLTDVQTNSSSDNSENVYANVVDREFSYDLGSSNDKLNLTIDPSNASAAGTATREDFVLEVNGNGGNDSITLNQTGYTAVGLAHSIENANITINGGSGDDTIMTPNEGQVVINAGAGNDTVYSDNTGLKSMWAVNAGPALAESATVVIAADATADGVITINGQTFNVLSGDTLADMTANILANYSSSEYTASSITAGTIIFSATSIGDLTDMTASSTAAAATIAAPTVVQGVDLTSAALVPAILYKAQLTVTYAGSTGLVAPVAAAGTVGYESTVTIGTNSYVGDQTHVNQAIKNAINNDAVLNKLLVATDGPANTLVITSLVDGVNVAGDIIIDIAAATFTDLNASELSGLQSAFEILSSDSTVASAQGTLDAAALAAVALTVPALASTGTLSSNLGTSNITNLGSDNDVLVLSTDATSVETIEFTGSSIGNNTIVNFTLAEDVLDFTSFLGNEISLSASTNSETTIGTLAAVVTVAGGVEVVGNDVIIINDFAAVGTETWDGLNASTLLASIKTDANVANDHGNLVDATLINTADTASFVGTTVKSIVLIENDTNEGEYKVFELTASDTDDDFTSAVLLGTVDFGAEIDGSIIVA